MYKIESKDITTTSALKEMRDKEKYIYEMKKIQISKDNYYFNEHRSVLKGLRSDRNYYARSYQHILTIPKKYFWLMKESHLVTYSSNLIDFVEKQKLVKLFKEKLQQKRHNNRTDFQSQTLSKVLTYLRINSLGNLMNSNAPIGLVRQLPNFWLDVSKRKKVTEWFDSKRPLNKNNHVGVEIECYMSIEKDEFAQVLNEKVPHLVKNVTVKDDGSLNPQEGQVSFELCIIDEENKISNTIKEILDIAKEYDLEIDYDCGVHVHLDMRHRDKNTSLFNLSKFQNLMYKLTDKSRKKNRFCKPIRVHETSSYIRKIIYSRNTEIRYKGINVRSFLSHQTYEIRIHAGCIDSDRLSSWIKLLTKIIDAKDIPMKVSTSVKKIGELLKLDDNLLQYVKKYSKIKKQLVA